MRELFLKLLEESFTNKKHVQQFTLLVDEAYALETSSVNTEELILKSKQGEIGAKLAVALANKEDASELIAEYQRISSLTTLEELHALGTEEVTSDDLDRIVAQELARENSLKLYPLALSERLGHRVAGGHHVVTYARPEMGKSALNLTIAGGFARQGASGLYFINEDRVEDLYMRQLSNITGLTEQEIRDNPNRAKAKAMELGLGNIRFISLSPGTPKQIESYTEKYEPKWIVVDQLRNLQVGDSNRVLQLEYAAVGMRTIAKKYNTIVVSTTQAGDSAEGKAVLGLGDCDYSNTGIPSQADVMVGIGATADQYNKGLRTISLPKNKITGRHESFVVQLNPFISRYSSINDRTEVPTAHADE